MYLEKYTLSLLFFLCFFSCAGVTITMKDTNKRSSTVLSFFLCCFSLPCPYVMILTNTVFFLICLLLFERQREFEELCHLLFYSSTAWELGILSGSPTYVAGTPLLLAPRVCTNRIAQFGSGSGIRTRNSSMG